jgi:proteasome lid subunit RPN8/RPN11
MSLGIQIRREVVRAMSEHASGDPGRECCGLLAGHGGVITRAFAARNVAGDPVRSYEIAPKEIVRLMRDFRAQNLEFLGIYHSHPTGENRPSARDIEQAYYSEAAYFILSPRSDAVKPARAFSIRDGQAQELEIVTIV